MQYLLANASRLVLLWLSLSVHEWAHARSAYALGDDTAKAMGRMTLDPTAHIDPVGTFLLPLLGVPFGWARPVPVNPARFRRDVSMSFGMMVTAAAGPISNFVLAGLAIGAWAVLLVVSPVLAYGTLGDLLQRLIELNIILGTFNLLPVPPLDGSRIVNHFLPDSLRGGWRAVEAAGRFLPFLVLIGLQTLGLNPFAVPLAVVENLMEWVQRATGR